MLIRPLAPNVSVGHVIIISLIQTLKLSLVVVVIFRLKLCT